MVPQKRLLILLLFLLLLVLVSKRALVSLYRMFSSERSTHHSTLQNVLLLFPITEYPLLQNVLLFLVLLFVLEQNAPLFAHQKVLIRRFSSSRARSSTCSTTEYSPYQNTTDHLVSPSQKDLQNAHHVDHSKVPSFCSSSCSAKRNSSERSNKTFSSSERSHHLVLIVDNLL